MVYGSTKSCSFNHAALLCWKWVAVAGPFMWTQQLDFRMPWGELKQTGSIVTLWQQKDQPKYNHIFEWQSILRKRIYLETEDLDPKVSSAIYHLWELTKLMNFPEFQLQRCTETDSYGLVGASHEYLLPVQWCYIRSLKLSMMGVLASWN